jgi:hypothetical protein
VQTKPSPSQPLKRNAFVSNQPSSLKGLRLTLFGGVSLDEVPVVKEYPDVFPEELPGMPPDRDVKFIIDLLPGIVPIAKRPYKMDIEELKELKK